MKKQKLRELENEREVTRGGKEGWKEQKKNKRSRNSGIARMEGRTALDERMEDAGERKEKEVKNIIKERRMDGRGGGMGGERGWEGRQHGRGDRLG